MSIRTLLVANRGEIARRVIRTARAMGIRTIAIFSDPDAAAPHVREADAAVRLPGAAPGETYLRGDRVLDAARRTGADAVHPGYGFLSENADFAQQCADAGVIFVGPDPEAIVEMGSKIRSKEIMAAAGVPVLSSATLSGEESEVEVIDRAAGIGFPLLVKASAGGGGRGMRLVNDPSEVVDAVASAQREAGSAFGDDTVFLERFVQGPRHVEVQIFGDRTGTVIHLFERDCSIQRRYQKIVEESPSPAVDEVLRARLGEAAIKAGKALGYVGAGTVEFVLGEDGAFHFLEVNTRLQVEHPVTEMVTGLDLVQLQLEVAQGIPLPVTATEAQMSGAAIEVRLYAEDPENDFLPTAGSLRSFSLAAGSGGSTGETVRVDAGVEDGSEVSIHYDSMLAKVIAHAPTRIQAADALLSTLRNARIHGPKTNRDLLVGILEEPEFRSGSTDTAYLERHTPADLVHGTREVAGHLSLVAAAVALISRNRLAAQVQTAVTAGFRNVRSQPSRVTFDQGGTEHVVEYVPRRRDLRPGGEGTLTLDITVDGDSQKPVVTRTSTVASSASGADGTLFTVSVEQDGILSTRTVSTEGDIIDVSGDGQSVTLTCVDPLPEPGTALSPGSLAAPMPGAVSRIEAEVGSFVEEGQVVLVLEAMKMEHSVRAPASGTLAEVVVAEGDQVNIGQELAVVDVAEDQTE